MTIPQALQIALQHHQAGRLAEAEGIYRQILAVQPNHADALHLLGVIAHQAGRNEAAVQWISKAITANPAGLHYYLNLGSAQFAQDNIDEAITAYRRALQFRPDFPEAHYHLGNMLRERGQLDAAITAFHQAIRFKPDFPEAHANLGAALHDKGSVDEAIASYRRVLQIKPDSPAIMNNLAAALRSSGQHDQAIAVYRRVLALTPESPGAHDNLGNALNDKGQLDEAIAAYRRALLIKPDFAQAHNNLGNALIIHGQFDEAIAAYRDALQFKPDYPEAHNNLGNALREGGRLDEAIAAYHRSLQIKPDSPEVYANLGNALRERGRFNESIEACRRSLQLKPNYPEAHNNLGNTLREQGDLKEAIAAFRHALQLRLNFPEAHTNLGNALRDRGRLDEAIAAHRRALEFRSNYPDAHNNLGNALRDRGQIDEAIASYRRALELKSDYPQAYGNLGAALRDRGQLDDAIALYRHALALKPDQPEVHSDLIFALRFHPGYASITIFEEEERWDRQFGQPLRQFHIPHRNSRNVERRLRIGYVSPDFRDHPVGRFALPLLERQDSERFFTLCYSGVTRTDPITERFRALAGKWRNTVGVSDARLAEVIREDAVDILVDLSMHTGSNRLPLFARQPAPIQISWLAYPGGAGLHSIGYHLTDAQMDPPAAQRNHHAGQPLLLPDCWCCYAPAGEYPGVTSLPALSGTGMTFGSLNAFAKVNDRVLALWARILHMVKRSRLVMLCPEGESRERVRAFFSSRHIEAERVEFTGIQERGEYLKLYQRIDLGLDPFPFNGMTTTCDALWMGVPVLTLPGEMPISRAGLSLLSCVGLGKFAAFSENNYVRLAEELAANPACLAELRATLRSRMQASPLMDAPRFVRNVETAYSSAWRTWCIGQCPQPGSV